MTEQVAAVGPHLAKHRIEALVDGIFAVAMTLLVIELRLPEHADAGNSAQLMATLHELVPTFSSWLVSFLVLALFWSGNHRLYSHVRQVDTPMVWYTIVLLAGASLLPFASAVAGRYISQLAQLVYALVMILMALGSILLSTRIYRHPELCSHPMDKASYTISCLRVGTLITIACLTVWMAGKIPQAANAAFSLLFLVRPVGTLLTRRMR